jgi:hypothetical protein
MVTTAATVAVFGWVGCYGPEDLTKVDQPPPEDINSGSNNDNILPGAGGAPSDPAGAPDGTGTPDGAGTSDGTGAPTDPATPPAPITAIVCVDAAGAEVAGAACGADNLCRDAAGNIVEGTCQEVVVQDCPASTSLSTSTSESVEDGTQSPEVIASGLADGMSISNSTSTSTSASCSTSTSLSTSTSTSVSTDDPADDGL